MCYNDSGWAPEPSTFREVLLGKGKKIGLSPEAETWCRRWYETREPYYGVFKGLDKTNRSATVLLACYEHYFTHGLKMGVDGCEFRTVQIPMGIHWEVAYNPATQSEYVQQLLGRWE